LFEGKSLYINELMVKKAAIVGALLMVLVNDPYFKEKIDHTSKALQGLLLKEQPKYRISQRTSVVLLIVRVLISSLFVFVGYGEIKRQIAVSQMAGVQHHGHRHGRPEGDGHDQMWLKVAQFALSMPFVVGWKTSLFARLLAIAMVAEALIYWQFWNTQLGMWYGIHARDHFTVNVGVAGGLLLLQEFGGGKFSVDEMLKKNQ
jgi:alanyl-tRNA synthetase